MSSGEVYSLQEVLCNLNTNEPVCMVVYVDDHRMVVYNDSMTFNVYEIVKNGYKAVDCFTIGNRVEFREACVIARDWIDFN